MNFGEQLKKARKKKKMSQDDLANILGINRVSISNYESNKNTPTLSNMNKILKALDLNSNYFDENNTKILLKTIPLIGLASCGIPQDYDLNGYDQIPISEELYHDGMYAVRAEGNSMSPKINDNALVYCRSAQHVENGHIVHYSINSESGIKKYKINEKGDIISLVPINSDFDIITIHADDGADLKMARVVGVVDMDF